MHAAGSRSVVCATWLQMLVREAAALGDRATWPRVTRLLWALVEYDFDLGESCSLAFYFEHVVEGCNDVTTLRGWQEVYARWIDEGIARGISLDDDTVRTWLLEYEQCPWPEVRFEAWASLHGLTVGWGLGDPDYVVDEDSLAIDPLEAYAKRARMGVHYGRDGDGLAFLADLPDAVACKVLVRTFVGSVGYDAWYAAAFDLLTRAGGEAALRRALRELRDVRPDELASLAAALGDRIGEETRTTFDAMMQGRRGLRRAVAPIEEFDVRDESLPTFDAEGLRRCVEASEKDFDLRKLALCHAAVARDASLRSMVVEFSYLSLGSLAVARLGVSLPEEKVTAATAVDATYTVPAAPVLSDAEAALVALQARLFDGTEGTFEMRFEAALQAPHDRAMCFEDVTILHRGIRSARALLRAQRVSFPEALLVMIAIKMLHEPGHCDFYYGGMRYARDHKEMALDTLEAGRGQANVEEWTAYRALRAKGLAAGEEVDLRELFLMVPPRHLRAEEEPLWQWALDHLDTTGETLIAMFYRRYCPRAVALANAMYQRTISAKTALRVGEMLERQWRFNHNASVPFVLPARTTPTTAP